MRVRERRRIIIMGNQMTQEKCDLRDAIKSRDEELLKRSIASGVDLNSKLPSCDYNALLLSIDEMLKEEIIEHIIENGASVNCACKSTNHLESPLTKTIEKGSLNIVKLLIAKGANVNKTLSNGETALTLAITFNEMRILLEQGANVDQKGHQGRTPLTCAIINNNIEAVQLLVANGASDNQANSDGTTARQLAEKSRQRSILKFLNSTERNEKIHAALKTFVEVKPKSLKETNVNEIDSEGLTLLAKAIASENLNVAKQLIQRGAKVCKVLPNGKTHLLMAVQTENLELVQLLLDNGAVHTIQSAFLEAITLTNLEIVDLLIGKGALLNVEYKDGNTPLTKAIETKKVQIVKKLVEKGANIQMPGRGGILPITLSIIGGDLEIVKYLVAQKAKLPINLLENCPFLLKNIEESNFEMVQILVEMGINLNVILESGYSPLTKALHLDNFQMVKYFAENGANVNQVDNNERSPLAIAVFNQDLVTIKFLIDANADIALAKNEIENFASCSDDFAIYLETLRGQYKAREEKHLFEDFGSEAKDD